MPQEKFTGSYHGRQLPQTVHNEVPFHWNVGCSDPGDQCLVANIRSVLDYWMPNNHLDKYQVAQLCGYERGKGSWQTQSLLGLAALGLEIQWIEDADLQGFATNPYAFMEQHFPDPRALKKQLDNSNIQLEAERVANYLQKGLPFEQRPGTLDDIMSFLADGYLARISINAAVLPDSWAVPGSYDPHSVLVVGYDARGAHIHDANSRTGNRPNRCVPWEALETAWAGFGRTKALNAYRMQFEGPV